MDYSFDLDPYNLDAYNSDSYNVTGFTGDIFDEEGNFNPEFIFLNPAPATDIDMVQGGSTVPASTFDYSKMDFALESLPQPNLPQSPSPGPKSVVSQIILPPEIKNWLPTVKFNQSDWYFQPLHDIIFENVEGNVDPNETLPDAGDMTQEMSTGSHGYPGIPAEYLNPYLAFDDKSSEFLLKKDPSSAKFFTTYHMCKRSMSGFKSVPPGNSSALHEVYHSRAMLFLAVGLPPPLFDRIRTLRWSELCLQTVTFADGQTVPSLIVKVEYGTLNPDGTQPIHGPGVVRHRWAEACTLDPMQANGQRPWWDLYLFSNEADGKNPLMKHRFDKIMRSYCTGIDGPNSELEQRNTIANWELYNLKRYLLSPPADLTKYLFPWLEEEISAFHQRLETLGRKATDFALSGLLTLLLHLREVIIQDAVVLFLKYSANPMFNMAPFTFPLFRTYAEVSRGFLLEHQNIQTTNLFAHHPIPTTHAYGMLEALEDIDQNAERIRPSLAKLAASSAQFPGGQENSTSVEKVKSALKVRQSGNKKDDDLQPPFTAQFFTNLT